MLRRAAIGGLLGGLCAGDLARAQWPSPPDGRRPAPPQVSRRIDPALPGGFVSAEDARRALAQVRVSITLDDEPMDASSDDALAECGAQLDVNADFGFYDDRDGPNAFTTLAPVLGWARNNPCILFGRRLLYQYSSGRRLGPGARMLYAHEHAHVRQFDERLALAAPAVELHADFLAGWVLARWGGRRHEPVDLDAATRPFAGGGRLYNDPRGHGTPQQRRDAVLAGHEAGRRGARLSDAVGDGLRWVGA